MRNFLSILDSPIMYIATIDAINPDEHIMIKRVKLSSNRVMINNGIIDAIIDAARTRIITFFI
jgi:hypothetical protein